MINTTNQYRKLTPQPAAPSLDNQNATPANVPAPLPIEEIESLLRSARKSLNQPASFPSAEELGPGDLQHLRSGANNEPATPIDVSSVAHQLDALQVFEVPSRQIELREELPATLNPVTHPDRSLNPSTPHGGLTLDDLGDVDLDISIELGRTEILIEDILKLREGSVVALDRLAGDPVDIVANGRLVARGELLIVEGKFGVRLSEVL